MPIFKQTKFRSAPMPAPTESMGINAPQGIPAPVLTAVNAILKTTISSTTAQTGIPYGLSNEPPLPSASIK